MKYKRPNVVTFAFQVSLHLLEDQPGIAINNSANIFRKDPSGTYFANCSKHLRPEVAIVPVSSPLPRVAEGLTGKSARKDINLPFVIAVICFPDVAIAFCFRSEVTTSELQSLMRISYAVFCLKKKTTTITIY